ncbi:hypothetical protein IPH19_02800 [Candidatus Uhrbacteria bacterium]|jgi:hypothetical protein|nr:MAG: hypothetical protein IPH19_02800 [Candidatus Uhrbacteria bacterium]
MDKQVTKEQIGSIVALLVAGKVPFEDAQGFINRYKKASSKKSRKQEVRDLITVPDVSSATVLINMAKAMLQLDAPRALGSYLLKWSFIRDERGKTYEVQIWKPGRQLVPATDVRGLFEDGFIGNTAAFIAWVIQQNPEGDHATIPEDLRLFITESDDRLADRDGFHRYAPHYIRKGNRRELGLHREVRRAWDADCAYVAFREVK